jgi:hypothetical protein
VTASEWRKPQNLKVRQRGESWVVLANGDKVIAEFKMSEHGALAERKASAHRDGIILGIIP